MAEFAASIIDTTQQMPICCVPTEIPRERSGEQHRKSRAPILIARTKSQFTTDLSQE